MIGQLPVITSNWMLLDVRVLPKKKCKINIQQTSKCQGVKVVCISKQVEQCVLEFQNNVNGRRCFVVEKSASDPYAIEKTPKNIDT